MTGGPDHGLTAYLGIGGNMGDRWSCLRRGVLALLHEPRITVTGISRVWESSYVGPGRQDPYLNLACRVRTTLPADDLLDVCQGIERAAGRRPDGHMKPRPLDLDILLYGDERRRDLRLTLPHPRLGERGFVLAPLADLAPDLVLPDSGETAAAAWARIRADQASELHLLEEPLVPRHAAAGGEEEWRAALAVHCR
jgi:2-amino-4-hydroxy-6-hydroxymethyldihydropteridine diphosphokinase